MIRRLPAALALLAAAIAQEAPKPILPGGQVVPLFPADSPYLKRDRLAEAEQFNMSRSVPGRVVSIVNIHNPSIEFHPVDPGMNTGAVIILAAGGGHNTLNVGSEAADLVPFFFNYGVNTVILRNRLRRDGYEPRTDAVYDALQAIRLVRARAKEWNLDPNRIGIMGFSAGAELAAAAAVSFVDFDAKETGGAVTSRPDFVGLVYPGPSPFARNRTPPPIPRNVPPAWVMCAGSGDRGHAVWALEYYNAMLAIGVPNIELHLYGNGRHPGDTLPDGSRMTAGLTDRNGIPFGKWQFSFVDWFRDLGFLQKPGLETKAAKESAAFAAAAPPSSKPATHGLIGRIKAQPGKRDELAAILLEGSNAMPGCLSYVVARDPQDPDALWVTEVWESEAAHKASLNLPAVKAAIAKGRPLIAGFDQYNTTQPVGGYGLATRR